ncbi:hypothetical protein ACQ856_30240 (plasmid) [Mycolicibacterium psychrotolerans]|uniref:hypothetical protein n=1 Tax=Mycolicibacterium psychrotolerans TaxID=216929 RepID=UPI003D67FBBD
MLRRIALVALGLYWSVCGALMALNPPPSGYRRSAALPLIGWVVIGASIYLAATAVASRDQSRWRPGAPPRHARSDSDKDPVSWPLALSAPVAVLAGAWAVWFGITTGYLSMVGLGLAAFPLAAGGLVYLVAALRPR